MSLIAQDQNPSPQEGTSMWYTGIDQHKQFSVLTTYGAEGPRVKQSRVPSTPLALQTCFAQFPGLHRAVVEPPARGTGSPIFSLASPSSSFSPTPRG